MSEHEDIEQAIRMFFAAAKTFKNIGLGVESAILFAPDDEQRFTVSQAINYIERYDMRIGGFVLEGKTDKRMTCIVFDGKSRSLSRDYLMRLINREDSEDEHDGT